MALLLALSSKINGVCDAWSAGEISGDAAINSLAEISECFEQVEAEGTVASSNMGRLRTCVQFAAKRIAAHIKDGAVDPLVGAHMIWNVALMIDAEPLNSLDPFIYIASESDDRPEDKGFFAAEAMRCVEPLLKEGVDF